MLFGSLGDNCLQLVIFVFTGVGQCFGEIALINDDNRRNASVVAAEDTHLLVIRKSLYDQTLKVRG